MTKPTCGQCEQWTVTYYDEGVCEVMPRAPGSVVLPVLARRAACHDFINDTLDGRGISDHRPST
jgi:hypothetical protein